MVHNLINVEVYPSFHRWSVNSYISLFANTQVSEADVIQYRGEQYKIITKNAIDKIPSHKAATWLVNSKDHPFIKKETNYYEFKVEKL